MVWGRIGCGVFHKMFESRGAPLSMVDERPLYFALKNDDPY